MVSDPEFEHYLILWELKIVRPRFYWGHASEAREFKLADSPGSAVMGNGRERRTKKPTEKLIVLTSDGREIQINA